MNHPIIGIRNIVYALRKYMRLIILLTVIGTFVGVCIFAGGYMGKKLGTRNYIIRASIAINAKNGSGLYPGNSASPDKNDFELEQEMVDAVSFICESKALLEKVVSKMPTSHLSVKQIQSALSLEQYKETQIIILKLNWPNSAQGEEVLNNILDLLPNSIIEAISVGSVSIISKPEISVVESVVSTKFVPLLFLAGLALGVIYAFLNLIFRPTLIDVRDVKYLFGKDFAGDIPLDLEYEETELEHNLVGENGISNEFKEHTAAISSVAENYLKESDSKKIIVTSTTSQEGKTCVATCIAAELSKLGRRVLLVDINTKNPSVGGLFFEGYDYSKSLNAVANGEVNIEDALAEVRDNLFVLQGMLRTEKVLLTDELTDKLNSIAEKFDVTIFDTSAMDTVVDVLKIKDIVKECLYVVGFDMCSVSQIQNGLINLEKVGVEVKGIVVNGVKPKERKTSYFLDRKALQIDKKVLGKSKKKKRKKKKKK